MENVVAGALKGVRRAVRTRKLSRKQVIVLSVALLVVLILFREPIKAVVSVAALFAFGAFSTYYKRKLESFGAVGFEFVTFTTVIAGIAFGPVVGAIFGFVTALTSVVISRDVGVTTGIFLAVTALIGAVAQNLSTHLNILVLGMAALVFSAASVQFFTFFILPYPEIKALTLVGIIVNFVVNYVLLLYLAKPIIWLIS